MRSVLFVPSNERMLTKIHTFKADAYIIDLEDSIPPARKSEALSDATAFLDSMPAENIYIRIDRSLIAGQITALKTLRFEGYMLPKFENPGDFSAFHDELSRRKNIALVETPMGLVNIREAASCAWVKAIAFGAEDYTAAVMMENSSEYLKGIKAGIVMHAKAFGKLALDTPFMNLNDDERFLAEVNISADLGFDGKLAVHPKQTATINDVFSRRNDPEFMREVIRLYEAGGEGAVSIGGKIYERMHIARFRKILGEE
ncbi:MAG: CoA ester lyase [Synergistaceae bacterium]|nr:CoA ester lyase [Synergistaceae bacterium]